MILSEAMQKLEAMFPRYGLEGWKPEYKRVLGDIPGAALQTGFNRTMDGWKKSTPPKPADILGNVPGAQTTSDLRPALTEDEAREWVETHGYMRDTFEKDWRNVLVRDAESAPG